MAKNKAYFAVQETLADWEYGHLLCELRTGRFTDSSYEVVTFSDDGEPKLTMGGVRVQPDAALDGVKPAQGDVLVLAGSAKWDEGGGRELTELAERYLDAGGFVAAICGATAGLARDGLLDDRRHTSAAPEYLASTGYAGGEHYIDARAVSDRGVVTAGPSSPVQLAAETLRMLGLADDATLAAYERVFSDSDASAYPALMAAA